MGAVLAIDPGTRYVGVAVSDPERTIAFPVDVLDAEPRSDLLERLAGIARERSADTLIVGRPVAMRGTPLPMTSIAEELAADISRQLGMHHELVDERLSSKEAATTTPHGQRTDASAAALFLQTYLDRNRASRG